MKNFLAKIWELPQKLLAVIVKKLSGAQLIGEYNDAKIYRWKWQGGLSLSTNIFIPFGAIDTLGKTKWEENYIKHEYGHTIQSKKLGLFYLIIIGLPSFLWAWLGKKYREQNDVSYYTFYTEKWADKLGGVNRE